MRCGSNRHRFRCRRISAVLQRLAVSKRLIPMIVPGHPFSLAALTSTRHLADVLSRISVFFPLRCISKSVAMMEQIPTATRFVAGRSRLLVRLTHLSVPLGVQTCFQFDIDKGNSVTATVVNSNPGAPQYGLNFSPVA